MAEYNNDEFVTYDTVILRLESAPHNPELQHQAVLALARAGSLDFALSEYKRYGLDKIRHHEDIMALFGRLFKDLYLSNSGDAAQDYALKSSEKYEAAYKDTGGYYSGINAATMALVGGMPIEIVMARAKTILRELPDIDNLSKETVYYIEATRAEAYLLLENEVEATVCLRHAVEHDPLNYTAHASTRKQFHIICNHRAAPCDWLTQFSPPKSAHYSGHIFSTTGASEPDGTISAATENKLRVNISDMVQRKDIGFGFGALAAGADILIAETLLAEGCELHVVLPVHKELFVKHSVAPFGYSWIKRFQFCVEKASSFNVITSDASWPAPDIDKFSRTIAMGTAIMQADILSVDAVQLLLWDGMQDTSWTAKTAAEWAVHKRPQYIIPYTEMRKTQHQKERRKKIGQIRVVLSSTECSDPKVFENINEAVLSALDLQQSSEMQTRIGIHMGISQNNNDVADIACILSGHAVPNSILVSGEVASYLAFHCQDIFATDYIGKVEGLGDSIRAFALKTKGTYLPSI